MDKKVGNIWNVYLKEKQTFKNALNQKISDEEMAYFFKRVLQYEKDFENQVEGNLKKNEAYSEICLKFYTKWLKDTFDELSKKEYLSTGQSENFINIFHYIQTSVAEKLK